jgi:hypothetical protein
MRTNTKRGEIKRVRCDACLPNKKYQRERDVQKSDRLSKLIVVRLNGESVVNDSRKTDQ